MAGDAHAQGHGDDKGKKEEKKKGGIWRIVGIVISVMIALIVLFWITSATIPMAGDGLISSIQNFSHVVSGVGVSMISLGASTSVLGVGVVGFLLRVALFILMGALIFWVLREGLNRLKAKKEAAH